LRFNSWDAVLRPHDLLEGVVVLLRSNRAEVAVFCGAFFLFSSVVYSFVFSARGFEPAETRQNRSWEKLTSACGVNDLRFKR
jgi:uncharacterized membrane protein